MKSVMSNRNFIFLFTILLLSTVSINFCKQIYQCACFFVAILASANFIAQNHGKKVGFMSMFFAAALTALMMSNISYTIYGVVYDNLIVASLVSILISFTISTHFFDKKDSLKMMISLAVAAITDGLVMSTYFVSKVSTLRVLDILSSEVSFKIFYSVLLVTVISLFSKYSNSLQKQN